MLNLTGLPDGPLRLVISRMDGVLVFAEAVQIHEGRTSLNLAGFPQGLYMMHLESAQGVQAQSFLIR
jgi:hypothetical protein